MKNSINTRLLIQFILIITFHAVVFSQGTAPDSTPSNLEDQLLKRAQRENEEAQAEFYREQIKKLREPTPIPPPLPINVTTLLGIFGALSAALVAALVGLLTLYVNSQAALRVQLDTQFYEALKRFGDSDSARARASAAGILAQIAPTKIHEFNLRNPVSTLIRSSYPYHVTSRNQLTGGLLFEDNTAALLFLRDALLELIDKDIDAHATAVMLHNVNRALQEQLRSSLGRFLISVGAKDPAHIAEEIWQRLGFITSYRLNDIKSLVEQNPSNFSKVFKRHLFEFEALTDEEKHKLLITTPGQLKTVAYRLYLNVDVFSYALRTCSVPDAFGKNPTFLANANLEKAALKSANLQKVVLTRAVLRDADLAHAKLEGAQLQGADLSGAKLFGVRIDSSTNMEAVNWWRSDFYSHSQANELDVELLNSLYKNFGSLAPSNLENLHQSVRDFLSLQTTTENKVDR